MIKETRFLKSVNYVYFYLLFTLISWLLIIVSFGLLILPVLKTLHISIYQVRTDEFDFNRNVIKNYFKNFKENIKIMKFVPFTIYFVITIISLQSSFSLVVLLINMLLFFVVTYIISVIVVLYDSSCSTLKEIYFKFLTTYSFKKQLDIAMYTFVFVLFAFFGFTKIFLVSLVLYQGIINIILKEKKND